jgi:predicted Rossmann-fold nucleotide-binding protein
MFKVIITGGKTYIPYKTFKERVNKILSKKEMKDVKIITSSNTGIDQMAQRYARELNITLKVYSIDFKEEGSIEKRNNLMIRYSDALIAFWDGDVATTNLINKFMEKHKANRIIKYKRGEVA